MPYLVCSPNAISQQSAIHKIGIPQMIGGFLLYRVNSAVILAKLLSSEESPLVGCSTFAVQNENHLVDFQYAVQADASQPYKLTSMIPDGIAHLEPIILADDYLVEALIAADVNGFGSNIRAIFSSGKPMNELLFDVFANSEKPGLQLAALDDSGLIQDIVGLTPEVDGYRFTFVKDGVLVSEVCGLGEITSTPGGNTWAVLNNHVLSRSTFEFRKI